MHKRGREEDVISQQDKHTYESVPVRFRVGSHDYIKGHAISGREKEQTIQNENHRNQRENRLILCDQVSMMADGILKNFCRRKGI